MRLVIDATPLLIRSAGVKTYLYQLIRALRGVAGQNAIRTFPPMGGFGPLTHERTVGGPWRTLAGRASLAAANYTPVLVVDWTARS